MGNSLSRLAGISSSPLAWSSILLLANVAIVGAIGYLVARRRAISRPALALGLTFLLFAMLAAITQGLALLELWSPVAGLREAAEVLSEVALIILAAVIWPAVIKISRLPSAERLAEEISRQMHTLDELRDVRGNLEKQVLARTAQLQETTQRFDMVLRRSPVSVFIQDRDLRYTWLRNPAPPFPSDALGKTDDEALPRDLAARLREVKLRVLDGGEPRRTELAVDNDGDIKWYDLTVEPLLAPDGSIVGISSVAVDMTLRKRSELASDLLLREITHRTKNLLAVIQSMVRHTSPRTASARDYGSRLGMRLHAMSVTHDLLVEGGWLGVSMPALVRAQLGSFVERIDNGISLDGPPLTLGPNASDTVGLVVHELIENAARHGALTTPSGTVRISWGLSGGGEDGRVVLSWLEAGGPPVGQPERSGFGRLLVEAAVGRSLGGGGMFNFRPEGVQCEISLPSYHVIAPGGETIAGPAVPAR